MKGTIGYPYTYGDCGGCFEFNSKTSKILLLFILTSSTLILKPSISSAVNSTELLADLALCVESGSKCRVERISHPADLFVCSAAGFCVAKASTLATSGRYKEAALLVCGGIISLCIKRAVKYLI